MGTIVIIIVLIIGVIIFVGYIISKSEEEEDENSSKPKPAYKFTEVRGSQSGEPFGWTTTLSGTNYGNCQEVIRDRVKTGDELKLVPDPGNKYDDTAVYATTKAGEKVGWIPAKNENIFEELTEGKEWKAQVKEVRKPTKEWNFYNLVVYVKRV